jgi:hypothetical protein
MVFLPQGLFLHKATKRPGHTKWVAHRETEHTASDWSRLADEARDFKCAEPSKSRPLSSVAVTCVGGWRAERELKRSGRDWSWMADESTWLEMRKTVQNSAAVVHVCHLCLRVVRWEGGRGGVRIASDWRWLAYEIMWLRRHGTVQN